MLKFDRIFKAQVKEYQRDAEEARQAREDMAASLREVEKRCRSAESVLSNVQEQLDAAVVSRRQLELERDELYDQVHNKG